MNADATPMTSKTPAITIVAGDTIISASAKIGTDQSNRGTEYKDQADLAHPLDVFSASVGRLEPLTAVVAPG